MVFSKRLRFRDLPPRVGHAKVERARHLAAFVIF
jgi:hypothetical protein